MDEYLLANHHGKNKGYFLTAKVIEKRFETHEVQELISQGDFVAAITYDNYKSEIYYRCATYAKGKTKTHIKEFFKQNGLNDTELKEVFKKGLLIKGGIN